MQSLGSLHSLEPMILFIAFLGRAREFALVGVGCVLVGLETGGSGSWRPSLSEVSEACLVTMALVSMPLRFGGLRKPLVSLCS